MKKLAPICVLLLLGMQVFSQVGINTTTPTSTLDVNGSLRVRTVDSIPENVEALRLIGVDQDGYFIPVEAEDNIILENNTLRAIETKYGFGNTALIVESAVHNVDLIILPGEPNDDKKVIRIMTQSGNVDITGFKAVEDGQTIWILAATGQVKLIGDSNGSDPENRMQFNGNITLQQYEMVQLIYDGTIQRWLLMVY